ncbi:MAG: nitroreductase family protein [Anaerolineaceae bacterium]|nr:nitroreductase family protein [Anaerolineaceae bacterium]
MSPFAFVRSLLRLLSGRPNVPASLKDNALLQVIYHRRSIRSFTDQPVSEDIFTAILEAGRLAPSTVNLQSWSFAVFTSDAWQKTFGHSIPFKAQRAVIILGDMHRVRTLVTGFPDSSLIDYTTAVMNASLAAMSMNLAAEALGISSVMLSETGRSGLLDAAYLKEVLCLPEKVFPIMTIVFGHSRAGYPPMPPKLPLETVCFEDKYKEPAASIMEDWLAQMVAGYKASHISSSFDAQLKIYQNKIGRAEADLENMIYCRPLDKDQLDQRP